MPRAHVALALVSFGTWNLSPADRELYYFLFQKLLERVIIEVEIGNLRALIRQTVIFYSVFALPLLASVLGLILTIIGWILSIALVLIRILAQVFLWGSRCLCRLVVERASNSGRSNFESDHLEGKSPLSKCVEDRSALTNLQTQYGSRLLCAGFQGREPSSQPCRQAAQMGPWVHQSPATPCN